MKGEENSKHVSNGGRGRGRGGFHGRGCGRGRGRGHFDGQERQSQERQSFSEQRRNKSSVQCYNCKKFGHVKANCWNQASYVEEESQESKLFMAHFHIY